MMYAVMAIVLMLILIIGIHELGHAVAAYFFSVKIQRVAMGFGKPLICYQAKSGIEWVWGRWPIGGYVQLLSKRSTTVKESEIPFCFESKPIWTRGVILLSGCLANFCAAILGLTVYFLLGYQQYLPVIEKISAKSPAVKAGFLPMDTIVAMNGIKVSSWQEANLRGIEALGNQKTQIVVQHHSGEQKQLVLDFSHLSKTNPSFWGNFGITPNGSIQQNIKAVSLLQALPKACTTFFQWLYFYMVLIKQLILGRIPFIFFSGPVAILSIAVLSFAQGVSIYSYFIALLSVSVGIVNLIPFPGLDGGSILYLFIEKVRGHPMSIAFEIFLFRTGQIVLWLLLVQLLLNDATIYLLSRS